MRLTLEMAGSMVTSTTLEKLPHFGTDCAHHSFFWFSKQASHASAASFIPLHHIHNVLLGYTQGQIRRSGSGSRVSMQEAGGTYCFFFISSRSSAIGLLSISAISSV